jgi:hypothetical protein
MKIKKIKKMKIKNYTDDAPSITLPERKKLSEKDQWK